MAVPYGTMKTMHGTFAPLAGQASRRVDFLARNAASYHVRAHRIACRLQRSGGAHKATHPARSVPASSFLGSPVVRREQPQEAALPARRSRGRQTAAAYGAGSSALPLSWALTVASLVLMLGAKTGLYKQILVPLLAFQLPHEVLSFLRGEYGLWLAFTAVLVRLFYGIPGELELPLATLLLVISAPTGLFAYRSHPGGILVLFAMAFVVAYTHFRETNGAEGAFNSPVLYTTVSVLVVLLIPLIVLGRVVYVRA